MNVLACAIRIMKMDMKDIGKAARSAAITGPREIIKPLPNIRLTGHDTERRNRNQVQIPGTKMGR